MTVANNVARNQYVAIASQTVFSYTFEITDTANISVWQRASSASPDDAADLLTYGTDYTLTGVGSENGGTVILVTGATVGDIVTIQSAIPVDRDTSFTPAGVIQAEDLNIEFDNQTLIEQKIQTIINKLTPRYPSSAVVASKDLILPILPANCTWVKNPSNTAITTYDLSAASGIFPGLANNLAYYATAGIQLSPLATANNGVLITSSSGVPSISSTLPSGLTIPTPIIDQVNDSNGNAVLKFSSTASAVNQLTITNSAAGNAPVLSATGTDSSIDITLTAKGTAGINLTGTTTTPAFIRFFEQTTNGTNNISFSAPASIASSRVIFLPDASGTVALTSQLPTGAALTKTDDTNVTLTLGGTPATALLEAVSLTLGWTGILAGTRGGTGVNNGSNTATYAGNLNFAGAFSTVGAFAVTQTYTGITNVTFPTTGTLATTSQLPVAAALTKTDDTNITLSLGGTPTTALLQATSLTLGWTGLLAESRGGTGIASLGSGIPTWLGTPSSANLASAMTDKTGTGLLVFANSPTLTTPIIDQINDASGNAVLKFSSVASAVNQLTITNSATGTPTTNSVLISATGTDSSIDITLSAKGTAGINLTGTATTPAFIRLFEQTTNGTNHIAFSAPASIASDRVIFLPDSSGTLALTSQLPTASALTKTDDTNVTLTLGGTPATALLQATSLTLGWTGQLGLTRGGSNASLTASIGGIVYSTASALAILAGTATANQIILSGSSAAPAWSTATYPATTTANQLLYSSANNVIAGLSTANSSVLKTDGSGVPSWSTTLPSGLSATNLALTTPTLGVASATSLSFSSTSGIIGTTTNNNAAAGSVGEYIENVISTATNFGTSGQYFDTSSIALTAGDWDISYLINVTANGATMTTGFRGGVWQSTGNNTTGLVIGSNALDSGNPTASIDQSIAIPSFRVSLASPTTYYGKAVASYSVATPQFTCRLSARRVR